MPRLFTAIELPDSVKTELGALREPGLRARWLAPAQMHLTVNFLGQVDALSMRRLEAALEGLSIEPFDAQIQGVGCFGPADRARVLWAGVGPSEPLAVLKGALDQRLADAGLTVDNPVFRPHITLARFGRRGGNVGEFLARHQDLNLEPFRVEYIGLFQSSLQSDGARYAVKNRFYFSF